MLLKYAKKKYIFQYLFYVIESTFSSSKPGEGYAVRNVKEDQARFLWFYKCNSFMVELNDNDEQAKKEVVACLRSLPPEKRLLKKIDEFEEESLDENAKNAVRWYTSSIVYRCVNEALVSGNISRIYPYRYLIKLVYRQLKALYKEYKQQPSKQTLHLFRGLRLKYSEIRLIANHINDLISLNSFVSTTLEEDIAKKFCNIRAAKDDEAVLFKIDIDMNNEHNIPFADISKFSQFPEEEEILISIGSIFRIESVTLDETKDLYTINLSMSPHDQLTVNEYIEQTFSTEIDANDQAVLFGKLLFDMGEYEFAVEYLQKQISNISDHNNHCRPTYLNNLGVCYDQINESKQALKYYTAASNMYKAVNNRRGFGACCHNVTITIQFIFILIFFLSQISSCYYSERNYDEAVKWALNALKERQNNDLEKASTLDLLGCIRIAQHDLEAAEQNVKEALQIRLRRLGETNPNHPDIGISYYNLGKIDMQNSAFLHARENYLKAEEIFQSNYPKTHPLVKNVEKRLRENDQYLSAS